jgi:hypothetical protein
MKKFLQDLIPKIQRLNKRLDDVTVLTNKHWAEWREDDLRVIYILSQNPNVIRITENGAIRKGTWEYLGNGKIEIEIDNSATLYLHSFHDDKILTLKRHGSNEFILLVNEPDFNDFFNNIQDINAYIDKLLVNQTYFHAKSTPNWRIKGDDIFNINDYPEVLIEIEDIKAIIEKYPSPEAAEMVLTYIKTHSLKSEWATKNSKLFLIISKGELSVGYIEQLTKASESNLKFQNDLFEFILNKLNV